MSVHNELFCLSLARSLEAVFLLVVDPPHHTSKLARHLPVRFRLLVVEPLLARPDELLPVSVTLLQATRQELTLPLPDRLLDVPVSDVNLKVADRSRRRYGRRLLL